MDPICYSNALSCEILGQVDGLDCCVTNRYEERVILPDEKKVHVNEHKALLFLVEMYLESEILNLDHIPSH